jgi:serine/threonine-protein kinase
VPPPGSPVSRKLRETLLTLTAAVLAFVVGLAVFNSLVMPQFIHREGEVRVPDLANLTVDQAEKLLSATGLPLSRAGERFDSGVERGRILQQDPAAATPVRGRRRVSVVVSLGEAFNSVPALFGETRRGAELLLERSGLRVGGITRAPSDAVGEGLVVATDPPAESVLPRDAPVALMLSSGLGEEVFVMPDLVGREIGRARKQLEALGFRVLSPPAGPTAGPIVTQDPPAGSRLTRDLSITLQASSRVLR